MYKQHHTRWNTRPDPIQQQQLGQKLIQKTTYRCKREGLKWQTQFCHCDTGTTNRGVHSQSWKRVPKFKTEGSRRAEGWNQINFEENQLIQVKHHKRRRKGNQRTEERSRKNGAYSWQGGVHGGNGQRRLWQEVWRTAEPIIIQSLTIRINHKTQKNKLIALLKTIKAEGGISDTIYKRLYPTGASTPKYYGLPKVHKEGVPLRPIISSRGTVTYETAKELSRILKPLVGRSPTMSRTPRTSLKVLKEFSCRKMSA